jgi:hypothetical protein
MDIPMNWRNVAFWAKTLMDEDRGLGPGGECRVCEANIVRGHGHYAACWRERLQASVAAVQADLRASPLPASGSGSPAFRPTAIGNSVGAWMRRWSRRSKSRAS